MLVKFVHVNQAAGREGVQRQQGEVRLVAGRRIWLVSVGYAKSLQGVVDSGSITGGALVRARQVGQPLEDILASVAASPEQLESVAGEYAEALKQHLPEIIGMVAAFLAAEALSVFLAATPTGVGQLAAAVIQLGLAAFGAQGMVEAGIEAVRHAMLRSFRPEQLHELLLKVEKSLREAIEKGTLPPKVMKELMEGGIPVGKKLAILELRHSGERSTV